MSTENTTNFSIFKNQDHICIDLDCPAYSQTYRAQIPIGICNPILLGENMAKEGCPNKFDIKKPPKDSNSPTNQSL